MTEHRKTSLGVPSAEVESSPKRDRKGFRESLGEGFRDMRGGLKESVGGLLEPLRLRSNSATKLDKLSPQTSPNLSRKNDGAEPNLARKSDGAEPTMAVDNAMKDALSAIENLKAGALERTMSGDKKSEKGDKKSEAVEPKLEFSQSAPLVTTAQSTKPPQSQSSEGAGHSVGFVHSQRVRADAVQQTFDKYGVDFLFMPELHAMEQMAHPELDLTYWEVAAAVLKKTLDARQEQGQDTGDAVASEVYHSVMTLQKTADLSALFGGEASSSFMAILNTWRKECDHRKIAYSKGQQLAALQKYGHIQKYQQLYGVTDVGSVVTRWMANSAVEYTLPSYVPVAQVAETFKKCVFLLKIENTSCNTSSEAPQPGCVLVTARVGAIALIRLHLVHRGNTDTIYQVDVRLINDPWAHLLPEGLRPRPTLDADHEKRFRVLNEFIGNEFNVIVSECNVQRLARLGKRATG
eukprot:comp20222_c0_seq1/m.25175 comp20222_c0_seq1/g.25175  ORF comp20222_c0_seq1/g.25175 comp20222_c0_seq1/m.25175 type:complete len:464 (-) comp20222_c0_seq1:431-1822(-)